MVMRDSSGLRGVVDGLLGAIARAARRLHRLEVLVEMDLFSRWSHSSFVGLKLAAR